MLPPGFVPNLPVTDNGGFLWPAGKPLPHEVEIPAGSSFPFPFVVPAGLPFSDTYTPDDNKDSDNNGTLYIISDFWDRDHTVSCLYPCTIVFPPSVTTTTWTPPPITTTVSGQTITFTIDVQTTEKVRISKTTVTSDQGSQPTKTILPLPALKPLCIDFTIPIVNIHVKFGLCPPDLSPFPPPIPPVTIVPVPPGGKSGPTNEPNEPSEDQKEEEDEEDEDSPVCPYVAPGADPDQYEDGTWASADIFAPDAYDPNNEDGSGEGSTGGGNGGGGGGGVGAGTGSPTTTTVTSTAAPPRTTPPGTTPSSTSNPVPAPTDGGHPVPPQPGTNEGHCWGGGSRQVYGHELQHALDSYCHWADGTTIHNNLELQIATPGSWWSVIVVGVTGKNNCVFTIREQECKDILNMVVGCKPYSASLLRIGGYVENNCATWILDPNTSLEGDCPPIPILEAFCLVADVFA